ncbi:nicotinate-nucleotide--dimethylbenzimidazole phosphoribosyltransferase [Inhella inkyongensis]|uniref:Nicotinate-nucleotide--dimethylbenzimidazole phosphoribosyltransferase n=1 Tax=Inhella inkyongensis TaxID=392593 RepID=A0A840S0H3_9BURK|nr:nicotinate-nucleotide--dimethylbenzimidazole phosphoribosyltransferase [Inhella inkyongensis]MBB5203283.1 nicotinate-nucleotide--dimethylbenzimidazole phosphoribosyltransferase [Inhella inkyongensis]
MTLHESLISPTANPELEKALRERLARRSAIAGGFGQLEELALRLALIQATETPRFRDPVLALFAADHGLAVEGVGAQWGRSTSDQAMLALQSRLPSAVLARLHGLALQVVDCGLATDLAPHPKLLLRKVAHGTRNARFGAAMTREQLHAALRVGMEVTDAQSGNVLACAGMGQGANESAALLLARLDAQHLKDLLSASSQHLVEVLELVLSRHREAVDAMDALAAFGGYEIAVMAGAMLVAASKRMLILIDGLPACAALRVAASIAPPVTDYVVFCRSNHEPGMDLALAGFKAMALLELGMDCADGTGAAIAWPLVRSAAALLSDVHEIPAAPIQPETDPSALDSALQPQQTTTPMGLDELPDSRLGATTRPSSPLLE